MSETEKLLIALMGIKETCEILGAETIEIENEMEDGTIETIDCIEVIENFIVDYVNKCQKSKNRKNTMEQVPS